MSKIIVLAGSPRKNGNTDRLAASFVKGAEERHEVEVIPVHSYDVNPCIGCNTCFTSPGNECVQEDDMSLIYRKLKETDMIVIASPVYFYGLSSQLKAVIDRCKRQVLFDKFRKIIFHTFLQNLYIDNHFFI